MAVAFLFPGQGSQQTGMLHELPMHPAVSRTLEEASELLKTDILSMDTEGKLRSTAAAQISLLTASVATARALQEEGATPDMVAGHSVGAFGAAVIAGVLEFEEALTLVKKRGEYMEQAFPDNYGMGVVLGLSQPELSSVLKNNNADDSVYIANINSPDQIVLAGQIKALEQAFELVLKNRARKAFLLNVSVPSHCSLLQPVTVKLAALLEAIPLREPDIPYAGNRTARPLRNAKAIREDLALSLSNPVRWHDATSVLFELGARLFIEMPPGQVLTDLAAKEFQGARSLSISVNGLKTAAILIEQEKAKL
ncbi:malonate decarboxylase subunit epsilon [Peribacillus glennii]|uniref:Malonyl CoA-acyl carrier protein transacylase n=1 Tax=Peribacillus glennii TaxID=2303991 RepID=A0A372LF79_9BACI|nr:malonate decarboxylase subunit epsilon [Peribacillus glennii]RFU64965.1 malonate decarboxylase subunit epsilon [Peribacillus glennii]